MDGLSGWGSASSWLSLSLSLSRPRPSRNHVSVPPALAKTAVLITPSERQRKRSWKPSSRSQDSSARARARVVIPALQRDPHAGGARTCIHVYLEHVFSRVAVRSRATRGLSLVNPLFWRRPWQHRLYGECGRISGSPRPILRHQRGQFYFNRSLRSIERNDGQLSIFPDFDHRYRVTSRAQSSRCNFANELRGKQVEHNWD